MIAGVLLLFNGNKMPSNTRRNSIDSVASFHEYDSEYEPSVVSEHDDDHDWNNACLDDEVVAAGIIKGSDYAATGIRRSERIRSRTNTSSTNNGSRRSERIRKQTVARIMIETNIGVRNRSSRK